MTLINQNSIIGVTSITSTASSDVITFHTSDTTERLRIDTSGNATFGGNVSVAGVLTYEDVTSVDAVGLSTFQNGIHVTGGSVGIGTDNPTFSNGSGLEVARDGTSCIRIEGNNQNHALEAYASSDGATLDARGSNANLMFDIGGSEKLRITSGGLVGIGTDNPERKIHVFNGTSGASSSNSNTGLILENSAASYLTFFTPNTVAPGLLFQDPEGAPGQLTYSHSDNAMLFSTNGDERLRINSSGNVGIGSQSPGVKLDVQAPGSSSRQNLARFRHEGQTDLVIQGQWGSQDIGGANGTLLYNSIQTLALRSGSSGDAHLVLRNSGNIGVGTAEPDAKLHIYQSDATNYSTTSDQRSEAELRITNPLETAGTFSSVNFYNGGGTGGDISLNAVKSSNYVSYFSIKQRAGGGSTDWRERLRIHPSGQVTMPEQPAWNLRPNSSSTETVSAGSNFVGWSSNTTGSSPSICFLKGGVTLAGSTGSTILGGASTGRITVPVAGRYKIWCTIRCENTPGAGNIYLWINNGLVARQHVEVWGRYNFAHGFHSHIVDLNANDYIQWQVTIGGGSYNISGYNDTVNWTGGHLIG